MRIDCNLYVLSYLFLALKVLDNNGQIRDENEHIARIKCKHRNDGSHANSIISKIPHQWKFNFYTQSTQLQFVLNERSLINCFLQKSLEVQASFAFSYCHFDMFGSLLSYLPYKHDSDSLILSVPRWHFRYFMILQAILLNILERGVYRQIY